MTSLASLDSGYVVLVMNPAECFTCSGTLAQWLEWRRENPERFAFVFTRRPSAAEKRRLMAVRLPVAGYLAAPPRVPTPVELLVESGEVVHVGHGVITPQHSALLPHLRARSLTDVASALRSRSAPALTPEGAR